MECSGERPRPHALLLPYPAQGHINPMIQLGKKLAALGVRVTFATMQHMHAKILRSQQALDQPISDGRGEFSLQPIQDGLPDDVDREKGTVALYHVIDETLQEGALELVRMLASQGSPVTFIIGDFFLRWTCSLARRTALPEFVFFPLSAVTFSTYYHLDSIISSGYHPFDDNVRATSSREDFKDMISCIPGLGPIHPTDLPFEMPYGKVGLDWLQTLIRFRLCHIDEAEGVIINSSEALEDKVCEALKNRKKQENNMEDGVHHTQSLTFVGPLVPSLLLNKEQQTIEGGKMRAEAMTAGASLWEEEVEECMEWLDEQPLASVVLVTFGSGILLSVNQVHELAAGLVASGQRFLWAIRKDSIRRETTGDLLNDAGEAAVELEEALPRGLLEAMNKHKCKVVKWAPQVRVLSHPSVGGFFSHCGWNSTAEAMCAGVPILGWPWHTDQVSNCWFATHVHKVGFTLPRNLDNQASKEDIERCVKELIEGPQTSDMRARARDLKKLVQDSTIASTLSLQSFVDGVQR